MKKAVLHFPPFAFYLCVFAKNAQIILVFFCGCFSSVSDAFSPPTNNVHICEVLDYEDMRARDSIYAATKQALNLNVGEPRTVRMIYFLPNDRPFQQEVVDRMKVTIREIQTFYADQMEAHGYGRKTFRFETDAEGEPVAHRVDGAHPNSYYVQKGGGGFWDDIPRKFDTRSNNVYLTFWDKGTSSIRPGVAGSGGGGRDGGSATVSDRFRWTTVAHELGHTFGLGHDWRDGNYIMSYGAGGSGRHSLSACAAEFLSVHPYFDPDIPDEETPPPTIELISSPGYPTGATNVSIQLKVSDPDGLHQVILFATSGLKVCRSLNGETNAVVQFDYDGIIPSSRDPLGTGTSLSDPLIHPIYVEAVDTEGNVDGESFKLWDVANRRNVIATLEGDRRVESLEFSPDGKTLATGREVWDIATQTQITTFRNFILAFSPDEKTLATRDGVWDIATRTKIISFTDNVSILTFSPDGTTIAQPYSDGAFGGKVKLWDIATRRTIAIFEGHMGRILSVAFSPNKTMLASGSQDGTVKLWDIPSRGNIATIEVKNKAFGMVRSIAFSPDGSLLASGLSNEGSPGRVKLLDVVTRRNIATFEHIYSVTSVAFPPAGAILASGSRDGTVKLWDVATKRNVTTLGGHTGEVWSVAFSPDGTTLASGDADGTILLWDASAIIPHPQTLVKISGDKQNGMPNKPLATPLIVEVQDQNGNALKGIAVIFAATEGARLSVIAATTNSRGRAQTRLTLGNTLGTTIVTVTVAGIDQPATFVIEAVATPDFDGDGIVGISDFLQFVDQFGFSQEDEGYEARFDLDGDGVIGIGDFLIFVDDFGKKVS